MDALSARHNRAWAEGLCASDLFYHYGLLIEDRTRQLQEQLNVQVSAAAVVIDKGKAYRALLEKLEGKVPDAEAKPRRPIEVTTPEDRTEASEMFASVEELWSQR